MLAWWAVFESAGTPKLQSTVRPTPLPLAVPVRMSQAVLVQVWTLIAGGMGGWAVAMGAFGAHALRARLDPNQMHAYETAASYHLVHSVALLALALYSRSQARKVGWAAPLMLVGTLLFSGSLYAITIAGVRGIGIVTPVGGVALLLGWAAVAWELGYTATARQAP